MNCVNDVSESKVASWHFSKIQSFYLICVQSSCLPSNGQWPTHCLELSLIFHRRLRVTRFAVQFSSQEMANLIAANNKILRIFQVLILVWLFSSKFIKKCQKRTQKTVFTFRTYWKIGTIHGVRTRLWVAMSAIKNCTFLLTTRCGSCFKKKITLQNLNFFSFLNR
jgi:hypothetical protein